MAAVGGNTASRYVRDRLAFVKALKSMPSAPKKGECQYAPAFEVLGCWVAHCTVMRMAYRGELPFEVAMYLNATIAQNSFCTKHTCSHGGVSQQNPDHEAFENCAFRLAGVLDWGDDGFYEYHKRHHNRTNTEHDPDLYLARLPLFTLGGFLLLGEGVEFGPDEQKAPWFHWDNVVLKQASFSAIRALQKSGEPDLVRAGDTLFATFRQAAQLGGTYGALFFARYPHRNCVSGQDNEVDSYFDTTNRGQAQVDLWMMGEGFHHAHHAKNDIPATLLARVGLEVEESHPELKALSRGHGGLADDEGGPLPPQLGPEEPAPCQRAWRRSSKVEQCIDLIPTDPEAAVAGMGEAIITSALEVSLLADLGLLRHLHDQMGLERMVSDQVMIPMGSWKETVWSEATKVQLRASADLIKANVVAAGAAVGAEFARAQSAAGAPLITCREDLKSRYVDFFAAVARTFVSGTAWQRFFEVFSKALPPPSKEGVKGVRAFLDHPIPQDITRVVRGEPVQDKGTQRGTKRQIADFVCHLRSRL